jgi:3-methyladenine DNA glycosylase AlkD
MNTQQARELGAQIAQLIRARKGEKAYGLLKPVLAERTPFRLLEHIGIPVGAVPIKVVNPFLDRIAVAGTEGGWVIIGSALRAHLDRDLAGAHARCRSFIILADTWYATDILGERVPGPALATAFEPALTLLKPWRVDSNRWVRRAVGVSIHFWAKRSQGAAELMDQATTLLALAEPMFEERDRDAVKGVGWGLKTLGRYYPDLVADWLAKQVVHRQRRCRATLLRKALTYLTEEQRRRATGETPP